MTRRVVSADTQLHERPSGGRKDPQLFAAVDGTELVLRRRRGRLGTMDGGHLRGRGRQPQLGVLGGGVLDVGHSHDDLGDLGEAVQGHDGIHSVRVWAGRLNEVWRR